MSCTVANRRRAASKAESLEADPLIVDAEPVPPHRGTREEWTISVVVDAAETVPASVWRTIASAGLDTAWQQRQGDHQQVLAVV